MKSTKTPCEVQYNLFNLINIRKSMSYTRWSEKETCYFVKLYLAQETLWNPKLPTYKSKQDRHKAYTKIITDFKTATGISMSEPEVTTKIKNLRSTYAQELSKIRRRSYGDRVFKPSIKWFPAWHKCFSTRFAKRDCDLDNSVSNQEEPVDDPCQKIWVSSEEVNDNDNSNSDPFESARDNFLLVLKPEPEDIKPDPPNPYKMKKKKFKHSTSTDNSDRSYRSSIDNETAKNDEFDIYGKYIASQLRKMDLQKALRLQLEIQSLVSEARISDINA